MTIELIYNSKLYLNLWYDVIVYIVRLNIIMGNKDRGVLVPILFIFFKLVSKDYWTSMRKIHVNTQGYLSLQIILIDICVHITCFI